MCGFLALTNGKQNAGTDGRGAGDVTQMLTGSKIRQRPVGEVPWGWEAIGSHGSDVQEERFCGTQDKIVFYFLVFFFLLFVCRLI